MNICIRLRLTREEEHAELIFREVPPDQWGITDDAILWVKDEHQLRYYSMHKYDLTVTHETTMEDIKDGGE